MKQSTPYNPLDKINLGASVAEALLEMDARPLGDIGERFDGAGVYAIYYSGPFEPYAMLSKQNQGGQFDAPIYVGKADAEGGRKGALGLDAIAGSPLYKRLRDHSKSIAQVENLDLSDFHYRCLIVEPIFVALGEALLIATFAPIWNNHLDGFGNHDPGKGRYQGLRPRWDALHPGRSWAGKCSPRSETPEQIATEIESLLRTKPFPRRVKMFRSSEE